ncbi:MAG: hypothetical protein I8H80_02725 [Alphaproteobacteria bacterium]|nr:hypothetical protein [Alphaproteobacteria bacterium]
MKQRFINSISLLAVCAVLSGCGEADRQKSVSELATEVGKDSQRLSVLSREALAAAKRGGVPLSFEAQKLFEDDIAEGSAPSPATAKEALGELEETISDLEILENQNSELPIVVKAKQTKRAKMKGLRDLMFARARAAAAARAAGKPVNPDDELSLTVPNDSFLGGAPNPSPMATVAAAAVQSLFPSTARAFGSVNALTVLDQVPAPGEFRVIMPGASRTPDSSSTIGFGVNRAAFSAGVGNTVELWFSAAQPISTSEAVRQTIELGVGVSHITGAVLGANADPALVASLTNIGALDMAQRSTAFKALSLPQQRLALQAAVAIAQATLVGKDQLRLEDRFNAVVLAIGVLPAGGAPEDRLAAVQRALQSQGVTNPLLLTDTMRAITVMAQTADMRSQEQARVLGTVLMIANRSGGVVSDTDYVALVAAVRSNPNLLSGTNPMASLPARFQLGSNALVLLKQHAEAINALPWSAASTSAAFIEAAGQQAQQLIAAGAQTDSISSSLVTSLTAARREKNSLVPATNGSVGIFGDSSDSGLSLAQTIQLLPTTTALDILVVAQETAVQALSATREAVVPFLAITDGSSAVNIPIDPAVEFARECSHETKHMI